MTCTWSVKTIDPILLMPAYATGARHYGQQLDLSVLGDDSQCGVCYAMCLQDRGILHSSPRYIYAAASATGYVRLWVMFPQN